MEERPESEIVRSRIAGLTVNFTRICHTVLQSGLPQQDASGYFLPFLATGISSFVLMLAILTSGTDGFNLCSPNGTIFVMFICLLHIVLGKLKALIFQE